MTSSISGTARRACAGRTTRRWSTRWCTRFNVGFRARCCSGRTSRRTTRFRLLDRYRNELPSFNDDIQGTAAVAVVAGIVAATRVTEIPLLQQRAWWCLGAGAAGIGIARLIRSTLRRAGLSGEALTLATASLDSRGLLVDDDEPIADDHKRAFAWPGGCWRRTLWPGRGTAARSAGRGARPETDRTHRHDR